jgi:hypothetical protein
MNRHPSAQGAISIGLSLVVAVGLAGSLISSSSRPAVVREVLLVELRRGPAGVLFELVGGSAIPLQCERSDTGSVRVTYPLGSSGGEPPRQSGSYGDAYVQESPAFCKLVDFRLRDSRGKTVEPR